jgi:uncharacterized repeat protein (TIGR03843 family)
MAKTPLTQAHSGDTDRSNSVETPEQQSLTEERILAVLRDGYMEERGLLPYSSNYAFLVTMSDDELELPGVYKPRRGENPLWDFPSGTLCRRETAAYEISAALDWNLVPPTVLRDGPHGLGSVQFFIDCDPDIHYFSMQEDARYAPALRQLSLFDFLINNADRKGGHCLFGADQRMWAIDHGICFHSEYKLRTVIWEYSDQPITDELLEDLVALKGALAEANSPLNVTLYDLLSHPEYSAVCSRLERLLTAERHPSPPPHQRNYPWPPI